MTTHPLSAAHREYDLDGPDDAYHCVVCNTSIYTVHPECDAFIRRNTCPVCGAQHLEEMAGDPCEDCGGYFFPRVVVRPGETIGDILPQLPLGGDWALVKQGADSILWLDVANDGQSATLNDYNTSTPVARGEDLYDIARGWLSWTGTSSAYRIEEVQS